MSKCKDDLKIIIPLWVIAGVFGYIYEVIFYFFDKGYFINRGSTFGPWIPIYGFGAIFIYILTKNIKDKKFIFLISLVLCGLLEFLTAYFLFHVMHIRLWDYNVEILNFGNVGGYICLRSLLLWGFCGLILNSFIIPNIINMYNRFKSQKIYLIWIVLAGLFLIDFIINIII